MVRGGWGKHLAKYFSPALPAIVFAALYLACNTPYVLRAQLGNAWVAFACGPFSIIEVFSGGNAVANFEANFVMPLLFLIAVPFTSLLLREPLTSSGSALRLLWLNETLLNPWEVLAYPVAATYITSAISWLSMGKPASGTSVIGVSLMATLTTYLVLLAAVIVKMLVAMPMRIRQANTYLIIAIAAIILVALSRAILADYFSPQLGSVTIELHGIGLAIFGTIWALSRLIAHLVLHPEK